MIYFLKEKSTLNNFHINIYNELIFSSVQDLFYEWNSK